MKLLFISLGCDKNRVDSEFMIGRLLGAFPGEEGLEMTDDEYEADVIIINSCCFIDDAKEESIGTILEMARHKQDGNLKALIVAGCLAERYRSEVLREIPEVDAILGTNSCGDIVDAVQAVLKGKPYAGFREQKGFLPVGGGRCLTTGGHFAYLKIAEGCDKHCTYCIIPSLRGAYRSVPLEELLAQARGLAEGGVKELILVAQETTLYGIDLYGEKSLHRLLDGLNAIPGLSWIRILYCYPEEIYEGLIDAMLRNDKVCHYLDIPIQHCSDSLLKRMGRRTTREGLTRQIARLRERIPDITLRTTVICGFPGETEEQHEELMQFLNEMEFDRLGAFAYSAEEGTPAAGFPDQVDDGTKERWRQEAMELEEEIISDKNRELVGQEFPVFIEGRVEDGEACIGRTYRDAPDVDGYIFINTREELLTGDFVMARVTGAYEYDLIGELL